MANITEQVLTLQTYDTLTIRDSNTRVDDGIMHGGFSAISLFFFFLCNTFTVHHKGNRLVTQRHIVKTDVWLSWASRGVIFPISDQFINSISREEIKVTRKSGLCQAPLAL